MTDKKHPCPDCSFCQWCGDDRCRLCRDCRFAPRRKISLAEQVTLYEKVNAETAMKKKLGGMSSATVRLHDQ